MMRPNDDTNDRIQKTYIHNKTDKTEGNNRIDRIRRYATRLIRLKETIELTEDTNDTQMNQSYNYANQIQRCYILFRFCCVRRRMVHFPDSDQRYTLSAGIANTYCMMSTYCSITSCRASSGLLSTIAPACRLGKSTQDKTAPRPGKPSFRRTTL